MPELVYPVSLQYRKEWGEWEAIRELVQNVLDLNTSYQIYQENGDTILQDSGQGLNVRHLLIGVSEKAAGSRGRFGEGLKFAMIVLIRLGYSVTIRSGSLIIKTSQVEIAGEQCLKLIYEDNPGYAQIGTKIVIHGYKGSLFEDRFAGHPSVASRVVHRSDYWGSIIDNHKSTLFVRDIYVTELRKAEFSYNLRTVSLSESRNLSDEFQTHSMIGFIWASVRDVALFERLIESSAKGGYECLCDFHSSPDHPSRLKEAFENKFGKKAVLYTSAIWSREAEWRGAKVIEAPVNIAKFLSYAVTTDQEYVTKHDSGQDVEVPVRQLDKRSRQSLYAAQATAKMLAPSFMSIEVKAYQLFNYENGRCATWHENSSQVRIDYRRLKDLHNTLSDTVHECAHAISHADDNTKEMIHALADVSSSAIIKITSDSGKHVRNAVRRYYALPQP